MNFKRRKFRAWQVIRHISTNVTKNSRKHFKDFNESVLINTFPIDITAGKLNLLEKVLWFTISLNTDQVLDVFLQLLFNNFS